MSKREYQIPPRWITRLFVWLCKPADVDDLLGDMEEIYGQRLLNQSRFQANYRYLLQCLALVFSYTVKKRKRTAAFIHNKWSTQNFISMYFNYLKLVLRRFRSNFTFSAINVFGLGVGLAACFLIVLFVQSERSYDRFHEDYDRIYRLTKSYPAGDATVNTVELRNYFMPVLSEQMPGIESYTRIRNLKTGLLITSEQSVIAEERVAFADANFFDFFSFKILQGDKEHLLNEPYTVVLSRSLAAKYFASGSPVGETMKVTFPNDGRELELKVTGVFEDMPVNSHLHKDMILSTLTGEAEQKGGNRIRSFVMQHNYFKLAAGQNIETVNKQLPVLEQEYAPDFFVRLGMHLHTQPLADIHLRSNMEGEFEANGSEQYLDLLSVLAVFILVMASFNYTNLATSQALDQAKEVGVRKVVGAARGQLLGRFMTESVTVSFISLLLAAFMVLLALPYFNQLTGSQLEFNLVEHSGFILKGFGLSLLIGVVSGLYPAIYMSSFEAVKSLKGNLSRHGKATRVLRKGLVIGQFAISAALIVSTGIVFRQFSFMIDRELGFQSESVLTVNINSLESKEAFHALKERLLSKPEVLGVSGSAKPPVSAFDLSNTNGIFLPGASDEISMNYIRVDRDFFQLYQIPMVIGQTYDAYQGEPLSGIVLNRTAMHRMGFTESNILGQRIKVYDGFEPEIIGIVEDFHFESLHNEIGPVYFQWVKDAEQFDVMSVKIAGSEMAETIRSMQETFEELVKTVPFEYSFLDDSVAQAYESEKYFVRTFGSFTTIALVLAFMGALGLAMQMAATRQKEVGVRKVMGASITAITGLLTRELLYMVLLANLLVWPLVYWIINSWLQDFPYRQPIGWSIFLIALLSSMAIAFLSAGSISFRAALINPVKSLRSE